MIRELAWRVFARIVTIPAVTDWLIARARLTPYTNITNRDGSDTYMVRLWLFNPYPSDGDKAGWEKWHESWRRHLPSARIHCILRADSDDHLHDHPWNARTTVLRGWYDDERPYTTPMFRVRLGNQLGELRNVYRRERGYTGTLLFGQYHRIREVADDGVWTLFITWKKRGTWGFLVDGVKVPWRRYLGLENT